MTGSTPSMSRFHLPSPSGVKRSARVPPGSAGPRSRSHTRGRNSFFGAPVATPLTSEAVTKRPGTYPVPSGEGSRLMRKGESV